MKDYPFQPVSALRRQTKRLATAIPVDLVAVSGFAVVAAVLLVVTNVSSSAIRAAVGIPLLFLAPGYVTVSALFPRSTPAQEAQADSRRLIEQTRPLTDVERVALSFGLSVALLPLLGLGISLTDWTFTGPVVVGTVTSVSLIGASLAIARRRSVPPADRYRVGVGSRLAAVRTWLLDTPSSFHVAVNVVLVLSLVFALTTVGYAFVSPQDGEQYTSLQLLTETDTGDYVASGYPSEIDAGDSIPLVIAVENREGQDKEYTVVVQEQRLEDGQVVERRERQRIDYWVIDERTVYGDRTITPSDDPGTVRLTVLLYDDGVPDTPTTENAYRHAYLWVDVTAATA